ncbi:hypothetical protein SH611_02570 [Geminicoccaceae bacterium 1502E]|nr:hypothetical protein [Geminicoccaceae bacterium 1502E]
MTVNGGDFFRSVYAYPWDIADEGTAAFADRLRALGADTVTLAAAYHAGKFLRPHGRAGKVFFPHDGTLAFRHDQAAYGRLKPAANRLLDTFDAFAALAAEAPDFRRVAWIVACHNTRLGTACPDVTVRNCFDDRYPYSLCPAQPDMQDFVVALCRDAARACTPAAIAVETPGWLPYEHGFHHEFAMMPLDDWTRLLLGLCFCDACIEGAQEAGIDAQRLQRRLAATLEDRLAAALPIGAARAQDQIAADLLQASELAAFLRWRCTVVTGLVERVRSSLPEEIELWVIPSVQRPSARSWIEGSDLAELARAADRLEICFYEASAEEVALDLADVRRRAGSSAVINGVLRPGWPDLAGGAETEAAVRVLREEVASLAFYNYGHLPEPALARIGAGFRALEVP